MLNIRKFITGLMLKPQNTTPVDTAGEIRYNSSTDKIEVFNGAVDSVVAEVKASQGASRLKNKDLEDSSTAVVNASDTTKKAKIDVSGATTGKTLTLSSSHTVDRTISIPDATDTLVAKATTDVLTNKTLSGNTASSLVNGSGTFSFNSSGTITAPNATDTLVGKATTDTLSNKTLDNSTVETIKDVNLTIQNSATPSKQLQFSASAIATSTTRTLTAPDANTTIVGTDATQTLTNKTLSGNTAASLINGSGTFSFNSSGTVTAPNATDTLVGKATTDTLSNKTFGDAPTFTQVTTPSNPSSGFNKFYSKSDGFFYSLDNNGTERKVGTGTGNINYIKNPDAESDTSGWATYADAAGNIPVDGTGGTATNLTFSRSTSSPLVDTASFLIQQANSTSLQGKGVSYDFTIDSAFQAQPLAITFNYNASSTFVAADGITAPLNDGTTTTNAGNSDVEVFIYDKTNAVLIPVSPQVLPAKGTNNFKFKGRFQTASNSTSYRLILHVATTSANATGWSLKYDNVVVGPEAVNYGAPVNDWTSYIPTFTGVGTPTNVTVQYRRVGDSYEVAGSFNAGTVSGAVASISLPNGASIDNTKITLLNTTAQNGQIIGQYGNPSTGANSWMITALGTSASVVYMGGLFTGVSALQPKNGNDLLTTGTLTSFRFVVPIAGLSSTVLMSNDTDSRIVSARAFLSANTTPGANTQINFDTVVFDTHAAITTGASWKFTAPVSGYYLVNSNVGNNATGGDINIFKNGSLSASVSQAPAGGTSVGSVIMKLVAGDFIDIRGTGASTYVGDPTDGSRQSHVDILKIANPSTVAATETVSARYHGATATVTASDSLVTYSTKDFDSHNAYSAGVYTVPVSGKYQISAGLYLAGTFSLNQAGALSIYKDNVQYSQNFIITAAGMGVVYVPLNDMVDCLAGDTIKIEVNTGATSPSVNASNVLNHFAIARVGN